MLTTPELTLDQPRDLTALQTVLPVIGGTVTEILEHFLGEPLRAVRLSQRSYACSEPQPVIGLDAGDLVLERRVVLCGAFTSRPVFCANSSIALDRLDSTIRNGLLTTDQPIGQLIRANRVALFRELLSCQRTRVPEIAELLRAPTDVPLLTRTYRMSARRAPLMVITEWFAC
jgi:chorismate-pyruvate lyase